MNQTHAEMFYRAGIAPWDIGEAQPVIRQLASLPSVITGDVLDPGCGSGWHAIEYARHGCTVTGYDLAPTAINRARMNAKRSDVSVTVTTTCGRISARRTRPSCTR